ncbi:phage tail assembly chaperone G [Lacticaseibacillus saniviri]
MKALKLKLKINGKYKEFSQDFIPLQLQLDAAEINEHIAEYTSEVEYVKAKLGLIVKAFDNPEITLETLLSGINAREAYTAIDGVMNEILGMNDPNLISAQKKVLAGPNIETQSSDSSEA